MAPPRLYARRFRDFIAQRVFMSECELRAGAGAGVAVMPHSSGEVAAGVLQQPPWELPRIATSGAPQGGGSSIGSGGGGARGMVTPVAAAAHRGMNAFEQQLGVRPSPLQLPPATTLDAQPALAALSLPVAALDDPVDDGLLGTAMVCNGAGNGNGNGSCAAPAAAHPSPTQGVLLSFTNLPLGTCGGQPDTSVSGKPSPVAHSTPTCLPVPAVVVQLHGAAAATAATTGVTHKV